VSANEPTLRAIVVEFGRLLGRVDTSGIAATIKQSLANGTLNQAKAQAHLDALRRLG
jgi:hypothetical protein